MNTGCQAEVSGAEELRRAYADSRPATNEVQQPNVPVAGSLRCESGFETDDLDNSEPCEIFPESCEVEKVQPIMITLVQDIPNGRAGLKQNSCKVEFVGTESGVRKPEWGRRGVNNFVIKLRNPLWHHAEKATVIIRTGAGELLGHGDFTFLPKRERPTKKKTSVSIHLKMPTDETSRRFQNAVYRGADYRVSSGTEAPSPGQTDSSTSDGYQSTMTVYFAYGEPAIKTFVERVIVFAANVGLPQGVSLVEVISAIPNFREALASCSFSERSLQGIIDYVYTCKSSKAVREEITELVRMAECEESDTTSCTEQDFGYEDNTLGQVQAASNQYNITKSGDIVPSETGLQLPPTSKMSSEVCRDIMMRFKNGEITQNKAIEMARDHTHATRQQGHKTTKGPDYSDSDSHSSPDERTPGPQFRKKPTKKPEKQKLIRSKFDSSRSKTSEWSTTSETTYNDSKLRRSSSNSSLDDFKDPGSTTKDSPTTELVDEKIQPKEIKHVSTEPSLRGNEESENSHSTKNLGSDEMNPNQRQYNRESRDSGIATDFDQSQGRPSPSPVTRQPQKSKAAHGLFRGTNPATH